MRYINIFKFPTHYKVALSYKKSGDINMKVPIYFIGTKLSIYKKLIQFILINTNYDVNYVLDKHLTNGCVNFNTDIKLLNQLCNNFIKLSFFDFIKYKTNINFLS